MGMESIDKVFKAYDVRGLYESQITEEMAWAIGFASAKFLRAQIQGMDSSKSELNRIVVGRDMRPHSPGLTRALIEGITASGVNCVDSQVFQLSDRVKVRVLAVNLDERKIDFELVE